MGDATNDAGGAVRVIGAVVPPMVSVTVSVPGADPVVTVIVADVAEVTVWDVMLAPVPPERVNGEPVQAVPVPVRVNTCPVRPV